MHKRGIGRTEQSQDLITARLHKIARDITDQHHAVNLLFEPGLPIGQDIGHSGQIAGVTHTLFKCNLPGWRQGQTTDRCITAVRQKQGDESFTHGPGLFENLGLQKLVVGVGDVVIGQLTQNPPRLFCFGRVETKEQVGGLVPPVTFQDVALQGPQHLPLVVLGRSPLQWGIQVNCHQIAPALLGCLGDKATVCTCLTELLDARQWLINGHP